VLQPQVGKKGGQFILLGCRQTGYRPHQLSHAHGANL
jgi:hypothetical protein